MAVDPNIKKKADDIRNKIYGKEVRESLASGLEEMSSDVVENEGRQSVVESRQDSVESQWEEVSDEMTDKDVISAPEIISARDGEANLKARLDKEKNEVTAQLDQKVGGLHPTRLTAVKDTIITSNTQPRVIDVFDGYVWADTTDHRIIKRPVNGGAWVFHSNAPSAGGQIYRLIKTSDGEVLALGYYALYKSSGFESGGSVSWSVKVRANEGTFFLQWGLDGYEDKFIATSYSGARASSRYAWISLDGGDTWEVKYDAVEEHGSVGDNSHMHAVCYDRWGDRFYLAEGHGSDIAGVYISEDNGNNWVTNENLKQNPSPTTLTATPDGIVAGSDNVLNGLYGIVRQENIEDESMELTWKWNPGRDDLVGFAQRGFYDEHSGLVYVSFRSDYPDVKPVVAAGTPTSGGLVFEWDIDVVAEDRIINLVIPKHDEILMYARTNNNSKQHFISAKISPPGSQSVIDHGNILGADMQTRGGSLAIGKGAIGRGIDSTAIGLNTSAGQSSVIIGKNIQSTSTNAVSVGRNSDTSANSVTLGFGSTSIGANNVVVGYQSYGDAETVAVGQDSRAISRGVALGAWASTRNESTKGVAIGYGTEAHSHSVALGADTETTIENQVAIGKRHLELTPLDEGSTGALPSSAEKARLFSRKRNGKIELCVQFPGADTWMNSIVVATQP